MSETQNSDWSVQLEEEIVALEATIASGSDAVTSEQIERLQKLVAEMERVVNGNPTR